MWEVESPTEEDIKPDFSAFLDVNSSQEVRDGKVPYLRNQLKIKIINFRYFVFFFGFLISLFFRIYFIFFKLLSIGK